MRDPAAPVRPVAQPARRRLPPRQGQAPARFSGFPANLASPEFPRVAPVSGGESIFTPVPGRRARGRRPSIATFSLSTVQRQLSAIKCCYPPHCSQAIHRTRSVRCSGGWWAAAESEAGQSAFGDSCRRVASWPGARFGHNKTRPPPFMGWRGPCAACRTSLASCPARPAKSPPHQGQTPARFTSFPGPPPSPGFPLSGARFRR